MRALVKLAAGLGNVGLAEREERQPGRGEVAVAVSGAGVCGTDLHVTSGFASTPRSWRRALELIERRLVELEPLVSGARPLEEWEQVFAELREARGIKVVFDPRPARPPREEVAR